MINLRILDPKHLSILFHIWILKTFHYKKFSKISLSVFFSQIRCETGNFSSDVYKNNFNLFGMRIPKIRKTTAIIERAKHALYSSYNSSIDDYFLWLDYNKIVPDNDDDFINKVLVKYKAETPISVYASTWKQIYNQEKQGDLILLEKIKKLPLPVFFTTHLLFFFLQFSF